MPMFADAVSIDDPGGQDTPLHKACHYGDCTVVSLLLNKGAHANATNAFDVCIL